MRKLAIIIITIALLVTLVLGVFAVIELSKNSREKDSNLKLTMGKLSSSETGYSTKVNTYEPPTTIISYRCGKCGK